MDLEVLAADVALGGEEHFDVLRRGIEAWREVGGCHLRGAVCRMRRMEDVVVKSVVFVQVGWSFEIGVCKFEVRWCVA